MSSFEGFDSSIEALPKEEVRTFLGEFNGISSNLIHSMVKEARRVKREAYQNLSPEIDRMMIMSQDSNGWDGVQCFHRTYVEGYDGLPVERSVLFSTHARGKLGPHARIVVNDVSQSRSDIDGRTVAIQDYSLSLSGPPRFGWRESSLSRAHYDTSWSVKPTTGPLLHMRGDHVQVVTGANYRMNHLDSVKRSPRSLDEAVIDGMQMERLTQILGNLNVSSYEPGYLVRKEF